LPPVRKIHTGHPKSLLQSDSKNPIAAVLGASLCIQLELRGMLLLFEFFTLEQAGYGDDFDGTNLNFRQTLMRSLPIRSSLALFAEHAVITNEVSAQSIPESQGFIIAAS